MEELHVIVEEIIKRLEQVAKMIETPVNILEMNEDRERLNNILPEVSGEEFTNYNQNGSWEDNSINLLERIKVAEFESAMAFMEKGNDISNRINSNWHIEFIDEMLHDESTDASKIISNIQKTEIDEPKGMLATGQYFISKEEQIASQNAQLIRMQTISEIREALKNMVINGRENTITEIKNMIEETTKGLRELEEATNQRAQELEGQYQDFHKRFEAGANNQNETTGPVELLREISIPRNNIFSRIAKAVGNGIKWIGEMLRKNKMDKDSQQEATAVRTDSRNRKREWATPNLRLIPNPSEKHPRDGEPSEKNTSQR